MNKIPMVVGIVLAVVGAAISAFTGIPAADFVGIAVAMIGAAIAGAGVAKKAKSEGVNTPLTYAATALIGFMGVPP